MKIVVLDGYAANPGDLSWSDLQALGECEVHDRTTREETVTRSVGAGALLTNKTVLDEEILGQLPDLKYIGVLATGYNVVDVDEAARRGVAVTNVPAYSTSSVAQLVFAHILDFCHHVADHSTSVRDGAWVNSKDFCFWEHPLVELQGKKLGIIGLGQIGSAVAQVATAFGMEVLAYAPRPPASPPEGVTLVDLNTVFSESDFVSLHCPLTDETNALVNAARLEQMKQTAFLVNTGRGPLVDEAALAHALNKGQIAGAGVDVLGSEPPRPDCPLLTAKNCTITPHVAWATRDARVRLLSTAINNLQAFLGGDSVNVVNGV